MALAGLVANPLVAAPGYTKGYRVKIIASGGTGAVTAFTTADTPGSAISLVQLKDSFGTPLIVGPGYETLQLVQMAGGQFGLNPYLADVMNLPTSSAISTATGTSGNFTLSTYLPLEFALPATESSHRRTPPCCRRCSSTSPPRAASPSPAPSSRRCSSSLTRTFIGCRRV